MSTVDIEKVKIKKSGTNNTDFEPTIKDYLRIAKKIIRRAANKVRDGLAEEMLKSDDAVSSIAFQVMVADWKWTPEFQGKNGVVASKKTFRYCLAFNGIRHYARRSYRRALREQSVLSLSTKIENEGRGTKSAELVDIIQDSRALTADTIAIKEESTTRKNGKVAKILESPLLNERESQYIRMHYMEGHTLQEIANLRQISRERVRQVIDKAFKKLQGDSNLLVEARS